ncbi:MAG UNVERIFIED_CONTAM: 1-acyl-sn-glycerol-3-phosphate acyltransferase [Rickettsiaceae bacterium]|jgi:acyl-[acyl-carrier-protein]-phospholipid O-acyltransferase/long-chain-fatty-acid--[acyl-carrier-protein] ligase
MENFHKAGPRAVIVPNHISYMDPPLLAVYLPEKVTFAINKTISEVSWLQFILKLGKSFPIDPTNPMATKSPINEIRKNKKVVIFQKAD